MPIPSRTSLPVLAHGIRRLGFWLGCAVLASGMMSPPAARAMEPIDYYKYEGEKPVISLDEFKEFFREGPDYMVNPETDKPFTDKDVTAFWKDMLKNQPELRPYLEARWDLLPSHLRGLSETAMGDMESMLHSILSLHSVPTLRMKDLPVEGRRLAKALSLIGPERLTAAVGNINKMDYYELEAVMQAIGTSVDELRPILKNPAELRSALSRIPEANVTLQGFGGVDGVLRIIQKLHLPLDEGTDNREPKPVQPVNVSSVGGMLGMAVPAISVLQSATPPAGGDPSQEPTQPRKRQADDPGFDPDPMIGPAAQTLPPAEPVKLKADDASTDDEFADRTNLDGEGDLGKAGTISADVQQKMDTPENSTGADLNLKAAACPITNVGLAAAQTDDTCVTADSSDSAEFSNFEGAMKDVNDVVDDIGDIGNVAAQVAMMANAATGAMLATSPDNAGLAQTILNTKSSYDNFRSLATDLNDMADMAAKIDPATGKASDPVTLNKVQDLMERHRMLSAGMQRSVDEANLINDPNVKSALDKLGTYAGSLGQTRNAVSALANIPSNMAGGADKVSALIASVTGSCPSGFMKDMLSAFESAGSTGLTKEDITDTVGQLVSSVGGKLPNGFEALAKLISDLLKAWKIVQKVLKFADTVRTVVNAVKSIKQLTDMATKMDEAKNAASSMNDTSTAMSALMSKAGNLDISTLDGALDAMDKVKKAEADKRMADCLKNAAGEAMRQDCKGVTGNSVPPTTQEEFDNFFQSMRDVQVTIAKGQNAAESCIQDLTQCPNIPALAKFNKIVAKAESYKAPINAAIFAMRVMDGNMAPAVNVSVQVNPAALTQNFQKYANKIPKLLSKIKNVPNLKNEMDKLTGKFAQVFSKLDELRQQLCIRAPNYSIYYCVPPINWPISQANLYSLINSFIADNRYQNYRRVGMIPGDMDVLTRLGLPLTQASYQVQMGVLGFGIEPITRGVAGSVPEKSMSVYTTPKVSPLNLNEGWLLRSTCPRTPSTYGWMTDEEDVNREDSDTTRREPSTDFKLPEDARQNVMTSMLEPAVKNVINCAPIKPAKQRCADSQKDANGICAKGTNQCDYQGCNPPFFIRLMEDSCANQYIASQSLFPTYINDSQSRPAITASLCQPLTIVPPDDCMKDANGKCMEDPERKGVVRHEYDAWRYLERAWYGTLVNNYFPAIYFPTINHWDEDYIRPYQQELLNPDAPNKTYMHNPNAQITAPGIDHYYEDRPTSILPVATGAAQFRQPEYRPQIQDLITHPYERIFDVTHPFTPRWDFEITDRDKYNVCYSMGLQSPPDYCGSKNFWFIPGFNRLPTWGVPVNCASQPVDILRFREKRFDNCIMCRITANRDCFWSEMKGVPIISIIIEVIRAVLYYVGKALCWGAGVCGDILVGVMDLVLFNPMGHNEAKNLWKVAEKKSDQDCKDSGKQKCRKIVGPIVAMITILKEGKTGCNGSNPSDYCYDQYGLNNAGSFSGNPYDQPFLRWITGSYDAFDNQVDLTAAKAIFQNYVGTDWKEMYATFKTKYRSTWKNTLRPIAEKTCGSWFGKHFPQLCFLARWKLRQAFKGAFGKGQDAFSKGVQKMGLVSFCKSDRTKQGRDMNPPCSTSASKKDKDPEYCKSHCKVSITDCCHEITKPLAPLNLLKLVPYTKKEKEENNFAEGSTFEEYFGNHRPYMRLWDTGTEAGAMNGKNIDTLSDVGSRVRIAGVGTAQRSCKIGGWGYKPDKPNERFTGDSGPVAQRCVSLPDDNTVHPLTSWTELKLYQMRTYRTTGLNCIAQFEKIHKPNTAEDAAMREAGGSVLVNSGGADKTIPWPLAHRGFLWDPDPLTRFPNFSKRKTASAQLLRGLSNAQPGDIVYLDPEDYNTAYPDRVRTKPDGTIEKIAQYEFTPFIGKVTAAYNESTFSSADPEDPSQQPTDEARANFSVTVQQGNAGQYPDSCGINEHAGNAKQRTIYRRAARLTNSLNPNTATRLAGLVAIQQKTPFQVYNTRCQSDLMTRECSFEDPRVTAKGHDLWDLVRIYRPYGTDYRGGCKVHPTSTTKKMVDINSISPNDIHLVPEKDVMDCLSAGFDPLVAGRKTQKNSHNYQVTVDTRGPGYEVTSIPTILRSLSMSLIGPAIKALGSSGDPQIQRLLKQYPEFANKPYIGFTGIPRYQSSHLLSLTVDASINVNYDTPHSGSLLKPGFNALGPLMEMNGLKDLMRESHDLTSMDAKGQLDRLYAGGAAAISAKSIPPATNGYHSPQTVLPVVEIAKVNATADAMVIGKDVELHLPPALNRNDPRTMQDEAQVVPDIAISKYPGFAIRGLSGDVPNLVLPPCSVANPKYCPQIPISNGVITITSDLVGNDARQAKADAGGKESGNKFDGDALILTPPDTQIQVPAGVARTMTFPYGVSFRHACKELVKFNGYAQFNVTKDGHLIVTKGEKAAEPYYYPLHADERTDPATGNKSQFYTFTPVTGYVPNVGDTVAMDMTKKLVPAINVLTSQLDVANKPRPETKVYGGEDTLRIAYDKNEMPGAKQSDMDSLMKDVNEVCSTQDDHTCPDGTAPKFTTRDAVYARAGVDLNQTDPASTPSACKSDLLDDSKGPDTNGCVRAMGDICVADASSAACKAQTEFCTAEPDAPICTVTSKCDGDFNKPHDEYQKCVDNEVNRCDKDPSGKGCDAELEYCNKNPDSNFCGGGTGTSSSGQTDSGGDKGPDYCQENPADPLCMKAKEIK